MATRRRTASPRRATGSSTGTSRRRTPTTSASRGPRISPDVARSLVGIAILVIGVITLVALILPGQGRLTDLWRNAVAPWMGAGRWFLPPLLIVAGIYVQQARGVGGRWGVALLGALGAYICFLGILSLINWNKVHGGYIGNGIESFLVGNGPKPGLIPKPAAFILLGAGMVGGILLAIDRSLPTVLAQLGRGARAAADTLAPPADPDMLAAAAAAKAASAQAANAQRGVARAVPVEFYADSTVGGRRPCRRRAFEHPGAEPGPDEPDDLVGS